MNKFATIAAMENQVKQLEIDICFAFRGREHDEVQNLRKARRDLMKEIAQVK